MAGNFSQGPTVRRQHGTAARHGLQDGKPKTFIQRWHDKKMCVPKETAQVLEFDVTNAAHIEPTPAIFLTQSVDDVLRAVNHSLERYAALPAGKLQRLQCAC